MSDAVLPLTHMDPTGTDKLLLVLDSSDAFVTESMASDGSLNDSWCSDDDVDLHRNIQQIIQQHSDDVIRK